MAEDSFTPEEIDEYGSRRNVSYASMKKYYDNEVVIRYYSKDETECVTLSRLFVSIYLSYEVAHNLKENIELMGKIVRLFNEQEYFEAESIYLIKKDSIYCSSLYRVYQCFEKQMFADACYMLKRSSSEKLLPMSTEVYNNFLYDECEVKLMKTIVRGIMPDEDSEIFEAVLITSVSYGAVGDTVNVEEILGRLNQISFEIFICHITASFLQDLVNGKSGKVKRGLNYYEQ